MSLSVDIKELRKIGEKLLRLSEQLDVDSIKDQERPDLSNNNSVLIEAERYYRLRRQRAKYFDRELFGEPAWDIILDLFIQGERGRAVSISSACLAADVPTTTALRCIRALMTKGLLYRTVDVTDGRRSHIKLTAEGRQAMLLFLDRALLG